MSSLPASQVRLQPKGVRLAGYGVEAPKSGFSATGLSACA